MDLIEIDGASHTGVDDVRRIIEAVAYRPNISARTVYIIDEVHMLSNAAFNALLKTLEEPPAHLLFLFATTEPEKIPSTILSRVQRLELKRLTLPLIVSNLESICKSEAIKANRDLLERIAAAADGSLRDAQTFLDQVLVLSGSSSIDAKVVETFLGTIGVQAELELIELFAKRDVDGLLQKVSFYYEQGKDLVSLMQRLVAWMRISLILSAAPQTKILEKEIRDEEKALLVGAFKGWTVGEIDYLFETLWAGYERAKQTEWPRLSVEAAIIRAARKPLASATTTASPVASATSYPAATPPRPPATQAQPPSTPAASNQPARSVEELMVEIKRRRPSGHALLICAEQRAVQGDKLILTFSKGHFAFKQLSEKILKKEMEELISTATAGKLKSLELIEKAPSAVAATTSASGPAPATSGRTFMADAKKAIVNDPAILKASKLLGAEVESVTIEGIKNP